MSDMHRMYHERVYLCISTAQARRVVTALRRKENSMEFPACPFTGDCFARAQFKKCKALNNTYFRGGSCPFQKRYGDITKGKRYPYDGDYDIDHRRHRNGTNDTK